MVYVVAAYSITISVLLVYGVLLQHRARLAGARPDGGFNLGAALLAPLWALFHGQRAAGATLLATSVALAAAQASGLTLAAGLLGALLAGASLVLGVVGNRIVSTGAHASAPGGGLAGGVAGNPVGSDPVARARAELRWALAGAVLHTIVLPWACYFWLAGR